MAHQSREIQAFLRQTSILDRFCAPLCDSALEITTSRRIIVKLEASNLFLIPLDDERHWYRYHHLFADFLVHRLHEAEPEHIPVLHRRASQWYENESLVDEAIQHAVAAEDMERATRLVDQIAPDLVVRREASKLLKLIDKLPPEGCLDYPMLCIWHAWALLFLGKLDVVEPILQNVEANQNKAPGFPIPGYVTTVRAYLANQWGHLQEAITLSERALELMSDAPPDRITLIFRGAAVIWLGVNHRLLGDLERASQLFDEAASLNNEAGNFYGAMAAYEQSAELAVMRGQLHQSMEFNKQGIKLAKRWVEEDKFGRGTSIAEAGPHFGLGAVLYQLNDLAGATTHIQRAADLFELGEIWGRMHSMRMQAYLKQAAGDYQAALELLSNACNIRDQIIVRQSNTADIPSLEQLRILLSRIHPEMAYLLTDAARRVEELGLQPEDEVDFSSPERYRREIDYTDLARVLIEQGRADEALPLLERLLSAARSMGRNGDEIRFLVLKALALQNIGDHKSAISVISLALHQARPEGNVRIFIDEGAPMAALLKHAILQDIESEYAIELMAAFPEEMRDSVEAELELVTIVQPLAEPLSERELEVLRLMATGLKYQEIAGKLVVSVNTVRHHTRNIYGKLDVNSRAQAIARAQDLGLL
jgi:LuxR family maltose regulon positive regulatory protein